jgi:trimeric autotransporter adhesin
MRRLFFIAGIIFLVKCANAQITYFGSASTPTDNSTNTATTTSVAPPASMVAGDLVIIIAYQRGTGTTYSVSNSGGQSWSNPYTLSANAATLSASVFWCRYNGSWSADPSILFSAGTNTNVIMHVFRPTNTSKVWDVDPEAVGTSSRGLAFMAVPGSPCNVGGFTFGNTNASAVLVFGAITDDDNTWTLSTANSSSVLGSAQYRNTAGSDASSMSAYRIFTSVNASYTGPVITQATLGCDGGLTYRLAFFESDPPAAVPSKPMTLLGVGG